MNIGSIGSIGNSGNIDNSSHITLMDGITRPLNEERKTPSDDSKSASFQPFVSHTNTLDRHLDQLIELYVSMKATPTDWSSNALIMYDKGKLATISLKVN